MNLWPPKNSQETAASVVTELKMKVRRHHSHFFSESPLKPKTVRLFWYLEILLKPKGGRAISFSAASFSLEPFNCITTTSVIVFCRAPLAIGHKISQRAIRDGSSRLSPSSEKSTD